ncbi:MAG: GNAT family N-acetyltransferase [Solirubrobacterales bacterium]|nr:GNAT family N-acetyltransferase [Solirubrobacterales bacterium]
MTAIPPLPQPMWAGPVGLRLTAQTDIPEILIAHQDDPQLHARLGAERPPSGAELGRELEEAAQKRALGRGVTLTILEAPANECRGQIYVHGIDWEQARASVGIWVAPGARGRGLARSALRLAGRWLFDASGLERLALVTDPDNEATIKAARSAGFVYEGLLRSYGLERGRRRDMVLLSLLPSDLEPGGGLMPAPATAQEPRP